MEVVRNNKLYGTIHSNAAGALEVRSLSATNFQGSAMQAMEEWRDGLKLTHISTYAGATLTLLPWEL